MTKNVFVVEGLPGVGKSYFCEILQQEIQHRMTNADVHFFEERDSDHPFHCSEDDIARDIWSIDYRDCFRIVETKCHAFFPKHIELMTSTSLIAVSCNDRCSTR
jgi:broad-specificity NMP kinase